MRVLRVQHLCDSHTRSARAPLDLYLCLLFFSPCFVSFLITILSVGVCRCPSKATFVIRTQETQTRRTSNNNNQKIYIHYLFRFYKRPKSWPAKPDFFFAGPSLYCLICLYQHLLSEGAVVRLDNNSQSKKVLFVLFQTVIFASFFLYLLLLFLLASLPISSSSFYYNDWPARPLDNEGYLFSLPNEFPSSKAFEMHLLVKSQCKRGSRLLFNLWWGSLDSLTTKSLGAQSRSHRFTQRELYRRLGAAIYFTCNEAEVDAVV